MVNGYFKNQNNIVPVSILLTRKSKIKYKNLREPVIKLLQNIEKKKL